MSKSFRSEMKIFRGSNYKCVTTGKVMYDKKSAQTAKNFRMKNDHVKLRIYQCPDCNQWHLTHRL